MIITVILPENSETVVASTISLGYELDAETKLSLKELKELVREDCKQLHIPESQILDIIFE